jgi:hypothetical protein
MVQNHGSPSGACAERKNAADHATSVEHNIIISVTEAEISLGRRENEIGHTTEQNNSRRLRSLVSVAGALLAKGIGGSAVWWDLPGYRRR